MKKEIRLFDVGVCLSDHDETGKLYEVINWGLDGDILIQCVTDDDLIKEIPQSDFWALI